MANGTTFRERCIRYFRRGAVGGAIFLMASAGAAQTPAEVRPDEAWL